MKKNHITYCSLAAVFCLVLFTAVSCATVSDIVSSGAQAAGDSGIIDKKVAASVSDAGKAIAKAAEVITPQQEYYIGRAVAGKILANYKRYRAQDLEKYLNEICAALVINSDDPVLYNGYHVAIIDSDQINALSTPGGHIFVTRGLIGCTQSEDALAAVIAHEVSHIQLKHAIKAIKSSRAANAILATAGTAAVASGSKQLTDLTDAFGETVDSVVNTLVDSGYSKQAEFEADENALRLMAAAGYNPAAMSDMLKLLDKKLGSSNTGFGKTHPSPQERLAHVTGELAAYPAADTSARRQTRYSAAVKSL